MAMDISFYTSPMSQEIRDKAYAEGYAKGWAKSQAEDRAKRILLLLDLRDIAISDEAREKVANCRDPQLLGQWFSRAVTATTTGEVFAEE